MTSSYRASPLLLPGTTIAGYRVDAVIGHGGMGVVYEATQLSLKRTIALKLLASHLSEDEVFRERFRREGELQARLDHPHIVTVHEAGESEHGLFLAMRLVRGPRLKDLVLARELDAGRTVRILTPIADALDAAHDQGLIHRDVKPQNILVGGRDHAFLADFGLTKLPGEKSLTQTGQFVGTLDYVAPEQIVGEPATARTDVYAFGAVLCECFTGGVPFLRENEAAVLYAHLSDEPPRVTEREPRLPAALDPVIARALAKEPADRYASAGELIADVGEALGDTPRTAIRQPPPVISGAQRETSERTEALRDEAVTASLQAEPERGPRPGHPRRTATLRLLGLAVIGAAGGVAAGLLASDDGNAAARAESGTMSFDVAPGWTVDDDGEPPQGMKLTDLVSASKDGQTIVAGLQRTPEPTLLPRAFKQQVKNGPVGPGEIVPLNGAEAQHHGPLLLKRSGDRMVVYAVPTSAGVATLTCRAPRGERVDSACAEAAATLRLRRGEPYRLVPDATFGAAVETVTAGLQPTRRTLRQRLGKARTRDQQQQAAGRMADVYRGASRRMASVEAPPAAAPATAAVVEALADAGDAYRRLRSEALEFDRVGYEAATESVRAAESRVQGSFDALRQLGYTII